MSIVSTFKEKILRLTREKKSKDYETLRGVHTTLISNLVSFLNDDLLAAIYTETEKNFRYTFNNPEKPEEEMGDLLTDTIRLAAGEGVLTYVTDNGKEQKMKLKYCARFVKGTERVIIDFEGDWKPGFTGYEEFGSVCHPGQRINTFPDFESSMNEQLASKKLVLLSWYSCADEAKVSFEIL